MKKQISKTDAKKIVTFYNKAFKRFKDVKIDSNGSVLNSFNSKNFYYGICGMLDDNNTLSRNVKCTMFTQISKSVRKTSTGLLSYFRTNELRLNFIQKSIKKYQKIVDKQ